MFSASKTAGSGGYNIANSLRFRSSASAYLNRTFSAGNQQTWTFSAWVKRGVLANYEQIFATGAANDSLLYFNNDDTLVFQYGSSVLQTTQVFRDPSSWYHIVFAYDSTQSTSSNRLKLCVNGVQVTAFSTANYPSLNGTTTINSAITHYIGTRSALSQYFDGYLTDINFVDGQALTPSSFGQISTVTGVWQPVKYSGTYGTNGFKLNFSNGASTTTLGYDSSGNGNNWTTNNISLTAGSTYDWMIDSPTPFAGSSYGVGNYAVLSPVALLNTGATTSNANLTVANVAQGGLNGSIAISSGKYYFEATVNTVGDIFIGAMDTTKQIGSIYPYSMTGAVYYFRDGQRYSNGGSGAYGASYTNGDVIGVALNLDSNQVTFYKNNTSQGALSISAGLYAPSTCTGGATSNATFNFGQCPFAYTPPTGYKSLCTYNLPAASIVNGASYMAATLYTGNGSTQSIVNTVNSVSFQPDFVWIKSRSAATDHKLTDVVRGVTKALISDSTAAETTDTNGLTAFNSGGFSIGSDSVYNTNAATYVGWQWKANGTAVSNTAGSITSQVSANTTSGFSVVTYTGTQANATVGHGLGIAPQFIIVKYRGGLSNWHCYHVSLGNTANINLNTIAAYDTSSAYWNSTTPTSSVFSLGTSDETNKSGGALVAYCFAAIPGYSAFGSYTGNGSADGPFVYCGFRPRFVFYKSTAGNWGVLYDTSENSYNVASQYLIADSSAAQNNGGATNNGTLDILSNGFKLRDTALQSNNSGTTYIYMAFAENPFQNALAR